MFLSCCIETDLNVGLITGPPYRPVLSSSSVVVVCPLSSSVTLPAGGPVAGRVDLRRAGGRDVGGRTGRHCTAGQSCYVPLGRDLVSVESRCIWDWPTEAADGLSERILVVWVNRVVEDELGVISGRVVDVTVLGDQLDSVDADVDAQSGLAVPVEVGRLGDVSDVVGRLEVACSVKILDNDVRRRPHLGLTCSHHTPDIGTLSTVLDWRW